MYLREEIFCTNNGSCNQLREEGDKEAVINNAFEGFYFTPIDIYGVAEGLEGEEGNAHGDEDVERFDSSGDEM